MIVLIYSLYLPINLEKMSIIIYRQIHLRTFNKCLLISRITFSFVVLSVLIRNDVILGNVHNHRNDFSIIF